MQFDLDPQLHELERLSRATWGAYEYLRDHQLTELSGTSKRLRAGNPGKLRARLVEELAELQGVLLGTHKHDGFPEDVVLEGYEVLYWAICLAVSENLSYEEIEIAASLQNGYTQVVLPVESLAEMFDELIAISMRISSASLVRRAIGLVGRACAFGEIEPARLLQRDLTEMRQKEYLAPYWKNVQTLGEVNYEQGEQAS